MATFTSTSTRITINGAYKDFTGGSGNTTTVIQYASGDAPANGDAGRFLLWKNGSNTGNWEVRFIASATSSTVTVTDGGFSSAPPNSSTFAISTSLDDIDAAYSNSIVRKEGRSFQIRDRDFELTNGAFVADVNASISSKSTQTGSGFIPTYPVANDCVLQFGRLIGGEANDSTETIGGCQLLLEISNDTLMFTNQGSFNSSGCVLNFYGCLLESVGNGFSPFIRAPGPMRIIGCIADGPMGGRLYSTASELVDTRFSGNLSGGVAWSLGASFTRNIDNVFFYQNVAAVKSFQAFTGTFSNTSFADSNTYIIEAAAQSGLLFSFVDCTTFDVSKINGNSGNYEQLKSINYTVTDSSGTGLNGVKVAVYDNVGGVQGGGVKTSSSGTVDIINARFFRKSHNVSTPINYAPFDIRIRKYGCTYLGFQSAVSEPIKQEIRLADNPNVVLSKADATALTGINIDFNTSTLTITSNHGVQNLYDYYQRQLEYDAKLAFPESWVKTGNSFDLADWDMVVDGCTYTGDITTTGLITLPNGGEITGTRTDANGTVLPPQPISITNISAGSRLQIYNVTTSTETVNQIVSGTSYTSSYTEGVEYTDGDTVRVRLTKLGKDEWTGNVIDTSSGFSVLAEQVDSTVYAAMGVDGSTVTKFAADYVQSDVNLVIGTDWTMAELYAWWMYNLTTEQGIREFFGGITAIDQSNFRINTSVVNLYLDNTTNASYKQTDNRRLFRDTGDGYPIKSPTTSGYGLDAVWRNTILIAETPTSGLTSSESAKLDTIASVDTKVDAIKNDTGSIPALL